MKRKFPIEICVTLVMVMLLAPTFAHASPPPPIPEPEPQPVIEIDLGGVITAVNDMFAGLNTAIGEVGEGVASLPNDLLSLFVGQLKLEMKEFITPLMALAKMLITANPDISAMQPLWQDIVNIISLFYLMLFLIAGLMLLFGSFDSEKRASAKIWFRNSIIIIIAVNASYMFYTLLLDLGSAVSLYLWSAELDPLLTADAIGIGAGISMLITFTVVAILAFITLFIRYLFLFMATALVPIAVFLYFIPPLRAWGSIILNLIGAAVFMQVLDVIILTGCALIIGDFGGVAGGSAWVPVMGLALVFVANALMIIFSALRAVNTAINEVPEIKVVAKGAVTAAKMAVL